jgi:hypothetical protein
MPADVPGDPSGGPTRRLPAQMRIIQWAAGKIGKGLLPYRYQIVIHTLPVDEGQSVAVIAAASKARRDWLQHIALDALLAAYHQQQAS